MNHEQENRSLHLHLAEVVDERDEALAEVERLRGAIQKYWESVPKNEEFPMSMHFAWHELRKAAGLPFSLEEQRTEAAKPEEG